ncbi:MAG: permease YjgP/YjgQ [Betaproteobacteria bacterium]|jgi:lipopolysaccharide export system permease protein|nr:permease YjgP/YjgQ [Betaproteobacteria bacterium]
MRTLRRYLASEITVATALVMTALLMLLAFFDLVHEVNDLGVGGYKLKDVVLHVLLSLPNHVYEAFPIAVLIGTLFAMAQLAASSEYVVIRSSGVSLIRLNLSLARLGLVFAIATFVFGEFVGPPAEQLAYRLRSHAIAGIIAQEFRSGLWVKEGRNFVNVARVTADGQLSNVRVYEFDADFHLSIIRLAGNGRYLGNRTWKLTDVVETSFDAKGAQVRKIPELEWVSVLEPRLLSTLVVQPDQMSAWSLYSYSRFLKENQQKPLRYEIALWTKLMYPVAVLVMMMLAVPFAVFQKRQGGVGAKIFTGIMLGLAFIVMNRLFGTVAVLYDWPAALSATLPTLTLLTLAVGMMWWQERR